MLRFTCLIYKQYVCIYIMHFHDDEDDENDENHDGHYYLLFLNPARCL